MDEIRIRGLQVYAYHGVYEEEQRLGQNFYVNATLALSLKEAGVNDDLDLTIDYGAVCAQIHSLMISRKFRLLESVAEYVAKELLISHSQLRCVTIEIEKPEAPIVQRFQSVSVCITRKWHEIVIAFGANLGDKQKQLDEALLRLKEDTQIRITRISDIIASKPYGGVKQPDFMNGAFLGETLYTPEELLSRLKQEEEVAGRTSGVHWGPRPLDLDIIYYDDFIVDDAHLTIPHKDMQNRDFVLIPLAQICPYKKHPVSGKTASKMLSSLKETYVASVL